MHDSYKNRKKTRVFDLAAQFFSFSPKNRPSGPRHSPPPGASPHTPRGQPNTPLRNDAASTALARPETASRNSSPRSISTALPQCRHATPAGSLQYPRSAFAVLHPPMARSGIAASARTAPQAIPPPTPGQHTAQKFRPGSLFESQSARCNTLFRYKKTVSQKRPQAAMKSPRNRRQLPTPKDRPRKKRQPAVRSLPATGDSSRLKRSSLQKPTAGCNEASPPTGDSSDTQRPLLKNSSRPQPKRPRNRQQSRYPKTAPQKPTAGRRPKAYDNKPPETGNTPNRQIQKSINTKPDRHDKNLRNHQT